jgi:hypothetical protein
VSELVTELLRVSHCELLLLEAGKWGRGLFGNPEGGERPQLEDATKQRLVKASLWTLVCVYVCVCVTVNCEV